ncbi:MAG: RNA polymerase sigma factor [Planctomycetes bacterium]|nr:RNA polymerase sigma factor [Planctomycetota bacterium]
MAQRANREPLDDAAVVARVLNGDVDAFELLVERHSASVRAIVAHHVSRFAAADVANDAFVSAFLALGSYAPTHAFERWLARITLRTCADFWRRRRTTARGSADGLEELVAPPPPNADDRELCDWALAHLTIEDRQVLTLTYFESRSVSECAELLSWSESKVKVRAHRARARLRRILRATVESPERRAQP